MGRRKLLKAKILDAPAGLYNNTLAIPCQEFSMAGYLGSRHSGLYILPCPFSRIDRSTNFICQDFHGLNEILRCGIYHPNHETYRKSSREMIFGRGGVLAAVSCRLRIAISLFIFNAKINIFCSLISDI
ncbi:MAG: hypothetical protein A2W25_07645 [candidate division Zixibacteria bacterium RBG_16_53_22]|nr:MAG: hypothetical protein A2W25_07645 [candidate division Zixibacteria bacterium RBG_16_53_22]